MPQRVRFNVVYATSTESGYNMKELETHNPQVKGWLSSRFCLYPQEVYLNLNEKIRIRQVQILAHEYLIPTKIDFYVGMTAPDHMTRSHQKDYKLLGYILLRDNVKNGHKLRELKSVNMDAVGQYVRLVVDKNYVNKYNLFNQVGLIAVNVIGDNKFTEDSESEDPRLVNQRVIDEFLLLKSNFKDSEGDLVDPALIEAVASTNYVSSTDDLAFDMYQDPEVATLIRKLETKRNDAISDKMFTLGKRLEKAIDNLKKAGEILNAYDIEKRRATELENYDLARLKKMQMEDYRRKMYKDLELQDLCRHCVIDFWYEKYGWEQQINEYTPSRDLPDRPPSHPFLRNPNLVRDDMPFVPRTLAPFETHFHPDDDRPLPSLASKELDIPPVSASADPATGAATAYSDSGRGREASDTVSGEMLDKIMKESAAAIDMFGQEMVIKVHSKNWSVREEGFKMLTAYLQNIAKGRSKEEMRHMLRACVTLSVKGLKDKVFAVFTATLQLVGSILEHWIPKHKLSAAQTVEIVLLEIMSRISDTNIRLKTCAVEFIVVMATYKEVVALKIVPRVCLAPFKANLQVKVALTRVDIVQKLVEKLGLKANSGLTVKNTTTFATHAMEHTQSSVREAAVNLIFDLYKLKGSEVIGYLPAQGDPKVLANKSLYWKLFDGLSRLVSTKIETTESVTQDKESHMDNKLETEDMLEMDAKKANHEELYEEDEMDISPDDLCDMQLGLANLKTRRASMRRDSVVNHESEKAAQTTPPKTGNPPVIFTPPPPRLASPRRRTPLQHAPSIVISSVLSRQSTLTPLANDDTTSDSFPAPLSRLSTQASFAPSAFGAVELGFGDFVNNQCVFCGEEDDSFLKQEGIDAHYAKLCPMLMPCHSCNQLVEISILHEHLLRECQHREKFTKCARCRQVKEASIIAKHNTCPVLQDSMTRCPLCNVVMTNCEEDWRRHLMGNYGCKASVKRQVAIRRYTEKDSFPSTPVKSITPRTLAADNTKHTDSKSKDFKYVAQTRTLAQDNQKTAVSKDSVPVQTRTRGSRIPRPIGKLTYSI